MISSILIIENQYISPVYLFKKSGIVTGIKIEQYEEYQKNSFRNRCILMGPNGLLPLSVPLVNGRHQKGLVRDIRICYKENWPLRHWRSIHDAYRKSPFFEVYMDDIKSFFESKPIFLFDWNLAWLEWLFKKSGSQCTISLTTE
ncbi:MAG: WbqC family protein, partial [Sphingobacteriales bacterium]|nr:WbqC family protein [Sphingobacteriales bacterium]